jgi:hypothetical protein
MNPKNNFLFCLIAATSLLLTVTVPPHKGDAALNCKPEDRAFLEKEYDVAPKEIELRIEEEHDLFVQKIVFVGAVLGSVFFSRLVRPQDSLNPTPVMVLCGWAAVAVAAIMDVRLMFNNIIIGDRGAWIRSLEGLFLSPEGNSAGWEHFFHKNSILWQRPQADFVFTDRQLLTCILFIMALFLSSFSTPHHERSHLKLFKAAAMGCLMMISLPGVYQVLNWQNCIPVLPHFVLIVFGFFCIYFWKPWPKLNNS